MSENKTAIERIPEQVRKVFEDNDIAISEGWTDNEYELTAYTDCCGEMTHSIFIREGRVEEPSEWLVAFQKVCDEFDPWRMAHLWMGEDGTPGESTPFSDGTRLLEDIADYKQYTLNATLNDLEDVVNYPKIPPYKFTDRIPRAIGLVFDRSDMGIVDVIVRKGAEDGRDCVYDITLTAWMPNDEEAIHHMSIRKYELEDYEAWAHAFHKVWEEWKPQNDEETSYKVNTLSVINDNLAFLDSLNFTHLLA